MGLLDEWGDALVEEGLREAADTFFGARTTLEREITFFEAQVVKLQAQAREIRSWFAGLNCLLGSEEAARLLFDALGVTLNDPELYTIQVCSLQFRRPRSFTRKGLFAKTVWEIYEPLAGLVQAYMHGAHYPDPLQPGRMRVSMHHALLARHCEEINGRIRSINESNRPSESLAFAKRMDQAQVFKESVTGGGGQTWNLDSALAFPLLDFGSFDLPVFPDLPADPKARVVIEDCCGRIFSRERAHVDAVLGEIFDPTDKTICVLERGEK